MFTLSPKNVELISVSDDWEPSDEDMKDHWAGEGDLTFHVLSYDPTSKYCPYEIDWDDYSGCVGGLNETLGITYAINEGILDVYPLRLGMTYHVKGITVMHTRGDGWTTDDNSDYYVESVSKIFYPRRFISAWWHHLAYHISKWRSKT